MMGLELSPCPATNSDGVLNFMLISVVTFSFTLKYVSLHIEFQKPWISICRLNNVLQNSKVFFGILLL